MKKVLTIAGSDSSGGAGIQADLKTIAAHKMYGMSVITALTAQNTQGVRAVQEATPEFVAQQIDAVFQDIVPDAVKVGMVSSSEIIAVIAEKMQTYHVKRLVVDPVMVATSGSVLLQPSAVTNLTTLLFPLSTVITPNILEAEFLWGQKITSKEEMMACGAALAQKFQCSVLVKGGHLVETANDFLYDKKNGGQWFTGERIANPNTHGTGCTLSSSIACELAAGVPLNKAVAASKKYLTGALKAGLNLGQGSGPLDHLYNLQRRDVLAAAKNER
ncbi:bifunctional hydroxymethylpyrimidine kinase/phosphomethylpyrimidine kinase [Enterococcus nangangensis]|uniref:bifunctional hydroxymethylpyrimidine kinase/phosphomethylpyrimidine kinase n=1 Tax=Enterococcus nangangensis TaxID=2559926 RepID=UPI0010F98408|nr:bifunctional hydroxymethylpyrimidine kinase/phosphomethylpyrimidine kinase [Enterococcus nangangensis]